MCSFVRRITMDTKHVGFVTPHCLPQGIVLPFGVVRVIFIQNAAANLTVGNLFGIDEIPMMQTHTTTENRWAHLFITFLFALAPLLSFESIYILNYSWFNFLPAACVCVDFYIFGWNCKIDVKQFVKNLWLFHWVCGVGVLFQKIETIWIS